MAKEGLKIATNTPKKPYEDKILKGKEKSKKIFKKEEKLDKAISDIIEIDELDSEEEDEILDNNVALEAEASKSKNNNNEEQKIAPLNIDLKTEPKTEPKTEIKNIPMHVENKKTEFSLKELEKKRKEIDTEKEELDVIRKDLEKKRSDIDTELRNLRKEEEKLRGHSKIDKILILIAELKDSIKVRNLSEEKLKSQGIKIELLNSISRKVIRNFSDYEFYVENAKNCQARIILILKYLTLLIKGADKDKITQQELRAYYKTRGILKALHIRLNPFDNHIHSKDNKPLELMRIFSALEPTATWLSSLDNEESLESEEYDKVVKSFQDFILEEKINFFKLYFTDEIVEYLDNRIQANCFVRLLGRIVLNPSQVLDQITKWEKTNPEFRKKFVSFLASELLPTERLSIAQKEVEELKQSKLL